MVNQHRRLLLWAEIATPILVLIAVSGIWISARQWPREVAPYLPASVVLRTATMGTSEYQIAVAHLDYAKYSTQGRANGAHALTGLLRGDKKQQLLALQLIDYQASKQSSPFLRDDCATLVFEMTSHHDLDIRIAAKNAWIGKIGKAHLEKFFDCDGISTRPATPDGWIPDSAARHAGLINVLITNGYGFVFPRTYNTIIQEHTDILLTREQKSGVFSSDLNSHLFCLQVLADLYGLTNDPTLRHAIERANEHVHKIIALNDLATLWSTDTTRALLLADCYRALMPIRLINDERMAILQKSYVAWTKERNSAQDLPMWNNNGVATVANTVDCWGALVSGAHLMGHMSLIPAQPILAAESLQKASPYGKYLTIVGLFLGNTATPAIQHQWREAFYAQRVVVAQNRMVTSDHLGMEGCWQAQAPYCDLWETHFSTIIFSYQ